jgi:hypothetical protein
MQRLKFNSSQYGEYRITRIQESVRVLILLCGLLMFLLISASVGTLGKYVILLPLLIAVTVVAIIYYFSFWSINSDAKELTESYIEYDDKSLIYKTWYLYGDTSSDSSFLCYKYIIDMKSPVTIKKRGNKYIIKGDLKCERKTRDLTSFYTCNSVKIPIYYCNIDSAISKLSSVK